MHKLQIEGHVWHPYIGGYPIGIQCINCPGHAVRMIFLYYMGLLLETTLYTLLIYLLSGSVPIRDGVDACTLLCYKPLLSILTSVY